VSLVGDISDNLPHIARGIWAILVLKCLLLGTMLAGMTTVYVLVSVVIQVVILVRLVRGTHLEGAENRRFSSNLILKDCRLNGGHAMCGTVCLSGLSEMTPLPSA